MKHSLCVILLPGGAGALHPEVEDASNRGFHRSAADRQPEAAKAEKPAETKKESAPAEPAPAKKSGDEEERAEAEVVPFSRPPDDPGVEPEVEEAPKSRFRLF